jgi:hypothetical protein
MALAWLSYEGTDGGQRRFRFDIGVNRYYGYAIGGKETLRSGGLKTLRDRHFESPMLGPLPETALGRGTLEIPDQAFDREHRYVQLMSYRTQERIGPAISEIVAVPAGGTAPGTDDGGGSLPELSFGQELIMDRQNMYVETVPFRFREARYSNAMFLGALANILPTVLPAVGSLVGNLFGGRGAASPGNGGGGGAAGALLQAIGKPETVQQIVDLIQQIAGASSGGANTGTATPTPTASGLVLANGYGFAYGRRGPARGPLYSEAQVAPALLAALPALMPILQQVLNPQTIQAVLDAPAKHTGMIIDGVKDFAKLGIQSHEQDLKHLRELNPGVDDPALDALLASLSLGLSQVGSDLNYRRVGAVRLSFDGVQVQTLYGQTKIPYYAGRELTFPFSIETPRPIGKAMVQLLVKDPETLEILAEKRARVERVESGPSPVTPTLSLAQIQNLVPGQDYLICLALVWKGKAGKQFGSSIKQKITLVSDYVFDRVEEAGELIPLNDVARYREFWHKIWGGNFDGDLKRYEWDCKYYYALNVERTTNARIETQTRMQKIEDRRASGQLKTGMELSPDELNRLLPRLAPGEVPLSAEELQPLRTGDFVNRFNQAARYKAKLRGRAGDSAALWVYPEFKLQRVVLQKVDQVNAHGHVVSFLEHPVRFPLPALIHLIGARTK